MGFPEQHRKINGPSEWVALLRQIRDAVQSGLIQQIPSSSIMGKAVDVVSIEENGPWPDYVDAVFKDLKGRKYRLTVETYHGMGGSWGPVD